MIEIISGPGVETVSPPSSGQPNDAASSPSACANGFSQASSTVRNASVSTKPAGRRALGGEVGQVHPQRLARDGAGRIAGQIMHALDDGIRRHHDVLALDLQGGRIVIEIERAGVGRKRFEIARDQRVLAGCGSASHA